MAIDLFTYLDEIKKDEEKKTLPKKESTPTKNPIITTEPKIEKLKPIKEKHDDLMKNKDYLAQILKDGSDNAQRLAYRTLSKVYRKIGLVEPKR